MTQKDIVSNAIQQLEKEKQEIEISKIKGIVKAYLEKILNKKEQIKIIQKELKDLEIDLDDLKSGRLDKIEERQSKDPNHKNNTLIFVKKIEADYLPFQPWRSPWIVEWCNNCPVVGSTSDTWIDPSFTTCTGTAFQNFTSGTYTINGQIFTL
jgi:DNA gyrase/topoisomerase IV subunit A